MSEPFVGEIRLFAGNFVPVWWMPCDGRTLYISEYEILFTLIGTTYGGDGIATFKSPDLRGRVPIHQGRSSEGIAQAIGQTGGQESVTLNRQQIPAHTHSVPASPVGATSRTAVGNARALLPDGEKAYSAGPASSEMAQTSVAGATEPHENRQPFLAITYIIAVEGVFPSPY
ncbi:phage tail protein [Nocardioides gilvus]|uniref:phage tail protein n=1 Tax=Nocardioides gilvus TaxID=1735589 RepID=UPI000D74F678|nr:tail fiber protein [Nocardioides gilvus]